nr:WD repeat containing protein 53 [Hymenolepis microstoma]
MATLSFSPLFNCTDTVFCLSLSNNYLALGLENGSTHIITPNSTPDSSITLSHSIDPCNALAFSDNFSDVLYSAHGGNVFSWDLRNPALPVFDLHVSDEEINSIDVNAQDRCIATADDFGSVSLISIANQKVTRVFKSHDNICSAVRFRPSWPNQLISSGFDCQLVIRDWKAGCRNKKIFSMVDLVDHRRFASLLSGERQTKNENRINGSSIRIASSFSQEENQRIVLMHTLGRDLPLNPPMVHSIGCSDSGDYVIAGLGNGTVEVFNGGKSLRHTESLFGHKRSVAAILPIGDSHVLTGGDDCNLFLWETAREGSGTQFVHSEKIGSLVGRELSRFFIADNTPTVKVVDLTRA